MTPDKKRFHGCCGQRKRARVIDGQLVEQPHECQKSEDVTGIDWKAVMDSQIRKRDASGFAERAMAEGRSIEDAIDMERAIENLCTETA